MRQGTARHALRDRAGEGRVSRQARERQVQTDIVRVLRLQGHLVLATNIEVPIGGDSREAMIARVQRKRMGVVSGTPDVAVCLPSARVLWLEVKAPPEPPTLRGLHLRRRAGGRVSVEQRELHAALAAKGHRVAVVASVEEALAAVKAALGAGAGSKAA